MAQECAPDEATGTLRLTASGWLAQFSLGGGQRKAVILRTCADEATATRRKLAIAKLVTKLREAGHPTMIPNVITDSGAADDAEFRKIALVVDRVAKGKEPGLSRLHGVRREGTTLEELAKLWTSGDLAAQFPDHVRPKKPLQMKNDERIFAWLSKVRLPDGSTFGARVVSELTLDDCDHVMGNLPKTAETPATRRAYAQALRKALVYAVYPLRLLASVPIPTGWLPSGSNDKAKAWLYPSEDFALMQCGKVSLVRRLFFGLLDREGMRTSEAMGLTWPDLDLDRGVVRLDSNKTNDPRSWVMGEDVTRALVAWKKLRGSKANKSPRVFPASELTRLARRLRESLTIAGVTRPELTIPKAGRLLLRAHDLRGSFVTLALATGRTEAWVTDRTGHRSSQMIYLYKRSSRTAAELGLGWFAPLDEAIPELSPKPRQGANGVQTGGASRPQTSGAKSRSTTKQGVSRHVGTLRLRFLKRRSHVQVVPGARLNRVSRAASVATAHSPRPSAEDSRCSGDDAAYGCALVFLPRDSRE